MKKNLILQNTTAKMVCVFEDTSDRFSDSISDTEINLGIGVSMTLDVVDTSQETKVANISVKFRKQSKVRNCNR